MGCGGLFLVLSFVSFSVEVGRFFAMRDSGHLFFF